MYEIEPGADALAERPVMYALLRRSAGLCTWKSIGNEPEAAFPMLVAVPERVTGVPAVAEVGDTVPAVRSG